MPAVDGAETKPGSAWAPFQHRAFAAMWDAQFVSSVGRWMQTVGAQWLMLSLTGSATCVALVTRVISGRAAIRSAQVRTGTCRAYRHYGSVTCGNPPANGWYVSAATGDSGAPFLCSSLWRERAGYCRLSFTARRRHPTPDSG